MPPVHHLVKDSTNIARQEVTDSSEPPIPITDATVTCTLYDAGGITVAGAVALPMTYDATEGAYLATLLHSLPLVLWAYYTLVITAVMADGSGRRVFREECQCVSG